MEGAGLTVINAVHKRQRNQRGEGARLRDEVIEAAMRILDRAPATELSLRMVAKEAGVAAPSLYRQFADADTMIKEIMRECWQQLASEMSAASHQVPELPPLARLHVQMNAYIQYAMLRPSRYQLLFAPNAKLEGEQDGPMRPASRATRELIEEHQAAGGRIPGVDAISATVFTLSFVHGRIGLAHLAPARPTNSPAAVQQFVRDGIERMFT